MSGKIEDVLLDLGVTNTVSGYYYIILAVKLLQQVQKAGKKINFHGEHGLYAILAEEYKSDASKVEVAIHNAVKKMKKDNAAWRKYVNVKKQTPTKVLPALAENTERDDVKNGTKNKNRAD